MTRTGWSSTVTLPSISIAHTAAGESAPSGDSRRMARPSSASRGVGASSSNRSFISAPARAAPLRTAHPRNWNLRIRALRRSRQYANEVGDRFADDDGSALEAQLANRPLVSARAFLDDGDRDADLAPRLEEPQQHDGVGKVTRVDRRLTARRDETVLRHQHDGADAFPAEAGEQLMQVQRQQLLARHGIEVAGETVDDDDARIELFDGGAHQMSEFPGGQLRGIDLPEHELARLNQRLHVETEARRTLQKRGDGFVKQENRRMVAARRRGAGVLRGD